MRRAASMAQHPFDERMRVFGRERAAALRGHGHGHIAPMRPTARAELVFEHDLRMGVVAVAVGDLLKRRSQERRVVRMAEHAMLLIDKGSRLGLGERSRCEEQQPGKKRNQRDVAGADMDDV